MPSDNLFEAIEELIRGLDNVYEVYSLDTETSAYILDKEAKAEYKGYIVVNEAASRMSLLGRKYCVFSKGFVEPIRDHLVMLYDEVFGLCGYDVPPHLRNTVPDDACWISDTFVMFPDKISGEAVKMIMKPYNFDLLNSVDGVSCALAYNPSLDSDVYLRKKLGFEGPSAATSTIIAFDV